MAEARKCDRCHEFYEINPFVHNYMTIGVRTIIGTNGKSYDLCPNCVELLDKWLKNPDSWTPDDCLGYIGDDTDCAGRSNGATEKELELASKLNDAKIYIAQLKLELGYTLTKEEIEFMKDPCESCHDGVCEQCDYGYCSEDEKKKRWLENHNKEEK